MWIGKLLQAWQIKYGASTTKSFELLEEGRMRKVIKGEKSARIKFGII